MTVLRDALLGFVAELREAGVRISVAESIDAMNAVAAAGLAEGRLREALAAALVKDEADRPAFDATFARYFARPQRTHEQHPDMRGESESPGAGRGRPGERPPIRKPESEPDAGKKSPVAREETSRVDSGRSGPPDEESRHRDEGQDRDQSERVPNQQTAIEAARIAQLRAIERKPFEQYNDLDYDLARDALAPLKRRFRIKLGRRLHLARRGRIDFRRTIRSAIQHGGALADLRFRSRRPRRVDLVILADISGSVRYAARLMLELVAGARECFGRVRSFVYVDRLAEADLEDGHVTMSPPLDLLALSDFGRVLGQLWEQRSEVLNRQTLVVIMGDARNNRRPARAEVIREIARVTRGVVWLNPEDPERWGTGDSSIRQYQREVTMLLGARNLHELTRALVNAA